MATKEQRDTISDIRTTRRYIARNRDLHVIVDNDGTEDYEITDVAVSAHRSAASRLWRELADTCADCGGSTAVGTPDPHVCGE